MPSSTPGCDGANPGGPAPPSTPGRPPTPVRGLRRRRGVTLTEVVVASGILALLGLGASRLLSAGASTTRRASGRAARVEALTSTFARTLGLARYAARIDSPGLGQESDRLEVSDLEEGGWRIHLDGDQVVLEEIFGATRTVLAHGVHGLGFRRTTRNPFLLEVVVAFQTERGQLRYSTSVYTRGIRRAR